MTFSVAALILLATVGGLGAPQSQAATFSRSGEYAARLAFTLSQITPVVVTADGPSGVTFVGRYTNTGPDPIDDIAVRFQRGPALATPAAVQAEVTKPSEPAEVVDGFRSLPGTLAPGQAAPFAITVPVFGDAADSLAVSAAGVYPVMMNVNATVHVGGDQARARVGELHTLVTVASVPVQAPGGPTGGPDTGSGGAENGPGATPGASLPVSILWPFADRPHLGVGNVFADDDLVSSITGSGRLADALAALASSDTDPSLVTIVVDPMLLDELQRMARGYRVLQTPDHRQQRMRPDGTVPGTVAGTGQRAAADYLDGLRALAAVHRVIVLPYGDADLTALSRAQMTETASDAIVQGRDIATRVLVQGPEASKIYSNLVLNAALPPDGALTETTAQLLLDLGDRGAVLAPGSVANTAGKPVTDGAVTVRPAADAKGDSDLFPAVVAGGSRATQFEQILDGTAPRQTALAVNALAAELFVTPADGRTPIVVMPPRRFAASATGLSALTDLVADLSPSRTLVPTSVPDLLSNLRAASAGGAAAAPPVTLAYSAKARAAELSQEYLQRIEQLRERVDGLNRTLAKAQKGGADPHTVLWPMDDALLPAVSSTWRGSTDPAADRLETIEATLVWLYGGVSISRDSGSYTLASSTAPLLLTVRNTLPYEVSVSVRIVGGAQAGLAATGPETITIGPGPRSVPVKLETTVSRSGTFTVYAQLYAATGTDWAGPVPLTIDSRAYGALTMILMSTAGGVLLLMVVWRLVQRARGRIDDPANRVRELMTPPNRAADPPVGGPPASDPPPSSDSPAAAPDPPDVSRAPHDPAEEPGTPIYRTPTREPAPEAEV